MEHLQRSITCPLCSQPYKVPRMISCLHSFCEECLCREVEKQSSTPQEGKGEGSAQSFECPICSTAVIVPNTGGGVKDLPQDLHLDFDVKASHYKSKMASGSKVACDSCIESVDSGSAVGFCWTCLRFLCQLCFDHHKRSRDLYLHHTVLLGEQLDKKEPVMLVEAPEPCCPVHEKAKEKLRFYCETCNSLICRDCTIVAHKDHKNVELSNIAHSHREEIKKLLVSAHGVTAKLDIAVGDNVKTMDEVSATEDHESQAIKDTFAKLHQMLDERMNELLVELHTTAVSRMTSLGLQRDNFEGLKQGVVRYHDFLSTAVHTYTDHELMGLKRMPSMMLQSAIKEAEGVSLLPCECSEFVVMLTTQPLFKKLSNFGHVLDSPPSPAKSTWIQKMLPIINIPYQITVETLTNTGEKYLYGELEVSANIQPKGNGQPIIGKVEDHNDGTYTITFIPQIAGPHQLLITMDGEHIINSPSDLEVRASKPNYQSIAMVVPTQLNDDIPSPLSIAIHGSGDIFIGSSNDCIYVLRQNGAKKATIGSTGNDCGQFNAPCGLAIKGNILYVADCNNHRIQKLTVNGEFLYSLGKQGSQQGEFQFPNALAVDSNDRVIVSDSGNLRVQVMNLDGTCLMSINGGIQSISGLGLDAQENIYVLDSTACRVLSPAGTLTKNYGYGSCSAIAINSDGFSILGIGNGMYVYNNYYQHTTSVSVSGEVKGIAFSPWDGNVYVVTDTQHTSSVIPLRHRRKAKGYAMSTVAPVLDVPAGTVLTFKA